LNTKTPPDIKMTVYTALFIALIIIGSHISIRLPLSPVPIVLADFFVMLAGLFLGLKYGALAVVLYLFLGIIGLPVFSNGGSGFAFILGPTGGFLIGYLLLVIAVGKLTTRKKYTPLKNLIAIIIGNILLYTSGVIWIKITLNLELPAATAMALIPFLPGTIIKIVLTMILGKIFFSRINKLQGDQQS